MQNMFFNDTVLDHGFKYGKVYPNNVKEKTQ